MRKPFFIITALIVTTIVCYGIAVLNSFEIALSLSGLSAEYAYSDSGIDVNGRQLKIISGYSDDEPIWAYMQKNALGLWSVVYAAKESIGWMKPAWIRRFSVTDNPVFEFESHIYYYGNDAIKLIDSSKLDLPQNAAVNVQQAGEKYWVHIVTFVGDDASFSVNVHQLLSDAGFVS